eukprot:13725709-Alexandrium_andersonii.AAC.1
MSLTKVGAATKAAASEPFRGLGPNGPLAHFRCSSCLASCPRGALAAGSGPSPAWAPSGCRRWCCLLYTSDAADDM